MGSRENLFCLVYLSFVSIASAMNDGFLITSFFPIFLLSIFFLRYSLNPIFFSVKVVHLPECCNLHGSFNTLYALLTENTSRRYSNYLELRISLSVSYPFCYYFSFFISYIFNYPEEAFGARNKFEFSIKNFELFFEKYFSFFFFFCYCKLFCLLDFNSCFIS